MACQHWCQHAEMSDPRQATDPPWQGSIVAAAACADTGCHSAGPCMRCDCSNPAVAPVNGEIDAIPEANSTAGDPFAAAEDFKVQSARI